MSTDKEIFLPFFPQNGEGGLHAAQGGAYLEPAHAGRDPLDGPPRDVDPGPAALLLGPAAGHVVEDLPGNENPRSLRVVAHLGRVSRDDQKVRQACGVPAEEVRLHPDEVSVPAAVVEDRLAAGPFPGGGGGGDGGGGGGGRGGGR